MLKLTALVDIFNQYVQLFEVYRQNCLEIKILQQNALEADRIKKDIRVIVSTYQMDDLIKCCS